MNRPDPIIWLAEALERAPDRFWFLSAIPGGGAAWQAREIEMAIKRGEVEARYEPGYAVPGYRYVTGYRPGDLPRVQLTDDPQAVALCPTCSCDLYADGSGHAVDCPADDEEAVG